MDEKLIELVARAITAADGDDLVWWEHSIPQAKAAIIAHEAYQELMRASNEAAAESAQDAQRRFEDE